MQNEEDIYIDKDVLHALSIAVFSELQKQEKGDIDHESSWLPQK